MTFWNISKSQYTINFDGPERYHWKIVTKWLQNDLNIIQNVYKMNLI